jgi:hypothetical protein
MRMRNKMDAQVEKFLRERFQSKDEKVDITVSYSILSNTR